MKIWNKECKAKAKPISGIIKLKKYSCPFSFIAGKKRTNVLGIPKVVKVETTIA